MRPFVMRWIQSPSSLYSRHRFFFSKCRCLGRAALAKGFEFRVKRDGIFGARLQTELLKRHPMIGMREF